jgi:hypothetical protein
LRANNRRLADQAGPLQRPHVLQIGRGEDVGAGTLLELGAQLLAAGQVEADLGPGMGLLEPRRQPLEGLAQGGRREDGQLLLRRRLGARDARDQQQEQRQPPHAATSATTWPVRAVP